MKCPKCDQKLTDKQAIKVLGKKIEQLERELIEIKLKAIINVPYVPFAPCEQFEYDPNPSYNPEFTHVYPIYTGLTGTVKITAGSDIEIE